MRITPPMTTDSTGRPVSQWDLDWLARGLKLRPDEHVLQMSGGLWGAYSSKELYDRDRKKAGRPLRFTLAQAQKIKSDFWSGKRTIVRMAIDYHCTEVTISRIVHGKTYWYA